MNSLLNYLYFCLCMTIFGCGADTSTGNGTDYTEQIATVDASLSDQFLELEDAQTSTLEIEGYFGQRAILSGIAEVPVLGFQETNTVGLGLVKIERQDGILSYRVQTCETKIERADDIVTTLIPKAFIDSIPISYRTGFVDGNNVHFSQLIELNGIVLNDPLLDELPTDINDGRIFDQDDDGLPGVTVFVSGLISGQINLIQRTITQLSGQFDEDKITGLIRWTIDEQILGSDQELLAMGAPITPNIDATRSVFELIRIPSNFDCDALIDAAPTLFDPEPLVINP
jgi:hypothetical protein